MTPCNEKELNKGKKGQTSKGNRPPRQSDLLFPEETMKGGTAVDVKSFGARKVSPWYDNQMGR